MKTFLLALCISTLSLSTIRSDDACCESKAAIIQTKLQDIDLACLLSKYEALQHAKTKMEIQLVLLDTEPSDTAPERQSLLNRNGEDARQASPPGD